MLRWPRRPETKPEADEGPSPFEPALLLTSWTKLFLGFCLPRLSRLPIAFAKKISQFEELRRESCRRLRT